MRPSHEHAPYRDDEPDRLPGESRRAYKKRTDPGYAERNREKRRRERQNKNLRRADHRLEMLRSGEITEAEYAARTADSDAWHERHAGEPTTG